MPRSVNSTCDLSHSGLPDFVAEGYAPPWTNRPPKNYREIFQVLRELIPEHG
jgi:hypothetical protein